MLSRSNLTQRAPNQKIRDFWPIDASPLKPAEIREAADKTGSHAKIHVYRQLSQHVKDIEHHINQLGTLANMDPQRRAVVLDTIRHSLGKEFADTFNRKLGRDAKEILKQDRRAFANLEFHGRTVRDLFLSDEKGVLSIENIVHYVIGHDVIRKLDLVMDTALQYICLSTACEGHPEPTLQTYWDYCEETFSGIHAAERRLYSSTTPLSNTLKNKFFIGGFPPGLQNLLTKFLKRNDVWVDDVKRNYYSPTDHGYVTIEHLVEATEQALDTNNLELSEFINSKGKGKSTRPTSDALEETSDRGPNVCVVNNPPPPPPGSYAYKHGRYQHNRQAGGHANGTPLSPRWKQNTQRQTYGQNADWADDGDNDTIASRINRHVNGKTRGKKPKASDQSKGRERPTFGPQICVVRKGAPCVPTQPTSPEATGNELPQQDDWARGIFRASQSPQHIQSLFSRQPETSYGDYPKASYGGTVEACY